METSIRAAMAMLILAVVALTVSSCAAPAAPEVAQQPMTNVEQLPATDVAQQPAANSAQPAAADSAREPVVFTATDFAYQGPASVPAGMTEIRVVNEGQEIHQAQLVKLAEGKSMADYGAAMQDGSEQMPQWASAWGGPSAAAPGQSSSAFVDLVEGQYLVLCNVFGSDGIPHVAKGMISPLSVTAADGRIALEPSPDVTIEGVDFAFKIGE